MLTHSLELQSLAWQPCNLHPTTAPSTSGYDRSGHKHDVIHIVYCLQYDTYKCISGLQDFYLPKCHSGDWADQMKTLMNLQDSTDSAAPLSSVNIGLT